MTPGVVTAVSRDEDPGFRSSGLTHSLDDAGPPSPIARVLLLLLSLYRATARLRAPRCRFLPTCSTFAVESIEVHGAGRGSWLALRRIARCHPWNPGGVDPVPPRSRGRHRRPSTRK